MYPCANVTLRRPTDVTGILSYRALTDGKYHEELARWLREAQFPPAKFVGLAGRRISWSIASDMAFFLSGMADPAISPEVERARLLAHSLRDAREMNLPGATVPSGATPRSHRYVRNVVFMPPVACERVKP